jgi:hypothetical protein
MDYKKILMAMALGVAGVALAKNLPVVKDYVGKYL